MIALAVAGLVSVIGVATPAVGQSSDKQNKQIEEYSQQLDRLAETDEWDVSEEDRSRARQWLDDARERVARGDTQTAEWLLQRTDELIELIQITVQTKKLQAEADEQEEKYHQLEEQRVPELKSELEELKKQKKKLNQDLQSLQ